LVTVSGGERFREFSDRLCLIALRLVVADQLKWHQPASYPRNHRTASAAMLMADASNSGDDF
jgi:hypothetical protein